MAKWLTREEALAKMQRYCAYQDRCHQEVRSKLLELEVYGERLEEIMGQLIEEGFLNEERFARSFARGKFRIKQWGRNRIRRELKARQVSDYCIRKGLEEIDETEYLETLRALLQKKLENGGEGALAQQKQKAVRYALSRGFEAELAWPMLEELLGG
ncbi:MAG: RecX family transcriptional regulator [Phaeodactylibacter sp.]|nr:RecX family transcriptional regulator [Phaeodactylibacter sp.]MCB9273046.1 RecX family transcriptional regulator [Lewinellaceae bacterium]